MAVTPWPFLPTGERDTFFCPYDTDGLAKVVLPAVTISGGLVSSAGRPWASRAELLRNRQADRAETLSAMKANRDAAEIF